MKHIIAGVLLAATWAFFAACIAAWAGALTFPAVLWGGLILILAWAGFDHITERGSNADRTRSVV